MEDNGAKIVSPHVMAQRWFKRFNNGNGSSRSGKPVEMDLNRLKQLIEDDPRLTTRCLAEQLGFSHTTVKTLRKTWKYKVWIPHELSAYQLDVCMDLLTSHCNYKWLRNLVTGDEKWVLCINDARKRQWF